MQQRNLVIIAVALVLALGIYFFFAGDQGPVVTDDPLVTDDPAAPGAVPMTEPAPADPTVAPADEPAPAGN
ncbi:hypothetical protein BH23PSE1_BH23PSE1_19490 [soil metagenome]